VEDGVQVQHEARRDRWRDCGCDAGHWRGAGRRYSRARHLGDDAAGAPGCDFSYAGGTDCGQNVDPATGEMAHLYHVTLGNLAFCTPGHAICSNPQPGWGLKNTGGFQNLQGGRYWYGTEDAGSPEPISSAWMFQPLDGLQERQAKVTDFPLAMAVRPGDVAAVPEPQTYAMLLLGLGAVLVAVRRRPL